MPQQIRVFKKSKCDFSDTEVEATASQGSTYAPNVLNRSNLTAWVTTGSVDADNTTLTIDFNDTKRLDSIILLKHNFKSYKIEYWNGSAWTAFPTAIDTTTNTAESTFHQFTAVETTQIKVTIRGTITANQDKYLFQLIATEEMGQFNAWPIIKPTVSRNRQRSKTLSGKEIVRPNIGAHQMQLNIAILRDSEDIALLEAIYDANEGVLIWVCGGDESQFSTAPRGYRLEDIFLMSPSAEYKPEFYKGLYQSGIVVKLDLVEVVD